MTRRVALLASVLAGLVLGTVSNWLYDLLRDEGFFPDQPTWKAIAIVMVAALPLIVLVVLPELEDRQRPETRELQEGQEPSGDTHHVPCIVHLRPLDVNHTFKDREDEIDALLKYLCDDGVRLITIVGRGGMGKTALACRVLADLEQGVLPVPGKKSMLAIDGILYLRAETLDLSLDRIYEGLRQMVDEPVASRLKARWESPDTPLVAQVGHLLEATRNGLYLILLDNFEDSLAEDHTIAEDGLRTFVEHCLVQPTGARLIMTLREQINLAGAGLHRVRSISLHKGLPGQDATALLRDLDPQATRGLRNAPQADLDRTAQLTSGIPRAMQLIAGLMHERPALTLAGLLEDKTLFEGQVMEKLFAEARQRLSQNDRRVMQALAVYDRPVTEKAVSYLLEPWFPDLDSRGSLNRLVSKYLANVRRATGEYSLHSRDREHVYRQLRNDRAGTEYSRHDLELRAAAFYASIRKPEQEWLSIEDLDPQLLEFEHRVRAEDYEGAFYVLEPIDFDVLFKWSKNTRRIELWSRLQGRLGNPRLQAASLAYLGHAHRILGQSDRAIDLLEEAREIAETHGDQERSSFCLGNLGSVYRDAGQLVKAVELYEQALTAAQKTGTPKMESRQLNRLGYTHCLLGEIQQAVKYQTKALVLAHKALDPWGKATHLVGLGLSHYLSGRFERATKCLIKSLAIAQDIGYRWGEATSQDYLGDVYRARGQTQDAIDCYQQGLALARQMSIRRVECTLLGNLGSIYSFPGQGHKAIDFHQSALEIADEIQDCHQQSRQRLGLGWALLANKEPKAARSHLESCRGLDVVLTRYRAKLGLGIVRLWEPGPAARCMFSEAVVDSKKLLSKTPDLFEAHYAFATAQLGKTVCELGWVEASRRAWLIAPAVAEYKRALDNCSAKGVVQDALRDLDLIRAAGIEGLEPVFALLKSAIEDQADQPSQ